MVAAHCHAGAYNNRWTIVVDDDIDPTNFNDVIWAMCTRCDPRDQVDIIDGGWSSALDPMCYDTADDRRNSRVDHRRLHPVPPQEDVSEGRALQQGARRPHAREVGEGSAEGILGEPLELCAAVTALAASAARLGAFSAAAEAPARRRRWL